MNDRRTLPTAEKDDPEMPKRGPFVVNVQAGKTYLWCSCGRSKNQPWCDNSHAGSKFLPIEFTAPIDGEFHMCGCKQSNNKPFCYGICRGHTNENSKWSLF